MAGAEPDMACPDDPAGPSMATAGNAAAAGPDVTGASGASPIGPGVTGASGASLAGTGNAATDVRPGAKSGIVTLDGPAGSGKTTLAKRVAGALGLPYLDTGAMFRALALRLGPGAAGLRGQVLRDRVAGLRFTLRGQGQDTALLLDGRELGQDIRTEEVARLASDLAVLPEVREGLKAAQRALGGTGALVAEGRDMGTAVFPSAGHKFYLDAAPEARAARRVAQLRAMGREADYPAILASIRQRDEKDAGRAAAPLKPAPDALVIDTTHLDEDGVYAVIMARIGV